MSRFEVLDTPLAGVRQVQRTRLCDERGALSRLFCSDELRVAGWLGPVAQINQTVTLRRGSVRGLHYQLPPDAEYKLVTCLRGEVWDVALDLRAGSSTYLQWHAVHLSPDNLTALLLPEGVAHGFQALTDGAELLYCHSRAYAPDSERGVHALDPRLAIRWPLEVGAMSQRDRAFPLLDDAFAGVRV
jgi:dTDP-4-dehydrorhamnose 3,5-epimerase